MSKGQAGLRKRAAGAEPVVQKRKRKRRSRLPKGFDPENPGPPPDPERWLPKWQRSEFKRKRRSRKDKVISLACWFAATGRWRHKPVGVAWVIAQIVTSTKCRIRARRATRAVRWMRALIAQTAPQRLLHQRQTCLSALVPVAKLADAEQHSQIFCS